jgi:hypothetical protein
MLLDNSGHCREKVEQVGKNMLFAREIFVLSPAKAASARGPMTQSQQSNSSLSPPGILRIFFPAAGRSAS